MSPIVLRLLGTIAVLAIAFGSGWAVNGWRLDAQQKQQMERMAEETAQRLMEQREEFSRRLAELRASETALSDQLDNFRRENRELREDIENAEVVTITERVEVPADCPAVPQCATVDSVRFRELYNRAGTGPALPDPGSSE